ncbi:hypothetical protein CXB51_024504 [Gossypium anomalum]|uniref:Uncharacterized protein n=1 Tax=Gossypium anomalum TaxID=47600 RepID=A0A8J5YUF2_9ROSI|nr:hypothetical protein CXB51_024504 [Gossypium anomalum]
MLACGSSASSPTVVVPQGMTSLLQPFTFNSMILVSILMGKS